MCLWMHLSIHFEGKLLMYRINHLLNSLHSLIAYHNMKIVLCKIFLYYVLLISFRSHHPILSHHKSLRSHLNKCFTSIINVWWVFVCVCVSIAPLSVRFSRQEQWSGLPFPSPGDLPDPGIESVSLASPASTGWFFYHCAICMVCVCVYKTIFSKTHVDRNYEVSTEPFIEFLLGYILFSQFSKLFLR